jgi:hypothetical protein
MRGAPRNINRQRWLLKTNGDKAYTKRTIVLTNVGRNGQEKNDTNTYPKSQETHKMHHKAAQNLHQAMHEYEKTQIYINIHRYTMVGTQNPAFVGKNT